MCLRMFGSRCQAFFLVLYKYVAFVITANLIDMLHVFNVMLLTTEEGRRKKQQKNINGS